MHTNQIIEINIKVFLLKDIPVRKMLSHISYMIDKTLCENEKWGQFHRDSQYKFYSVSNLSPVEKDCLYKKEKVYRYSIRTLNEELAEYLLETLPSRNTEEMKGLIAEPKLIPRRPIREISSLTPLLIKWNGDGYWGGNIGFEQFENLVKINLIKKYNQFYDTKIEEDFPLWSLFEKTNRQPIPIDYKGKTFLGDKVRIIIEDNPMAQEIAYLSIAAGLGIGNGRGNGFVSYRFS